MLEIRFAHHGGITQRIRRAGRNGRFTALLIGLTAVGGGLGRFQTRPLESLFTFTLLIGICFLKGKKKPLRTGGFEGAHQESLPPLIAPQCDFFD
jgi:hypothetical protein